MLPVNYYRMYSKNPYIRTTFFCVRLAKVLKLQPFKKIFSQYAGIEMDNLIEQWSAITSGAFPICYGYDLPDLPHKYSFTQNKS